MTDPLTTVVSDTRRLIQLFDSIADSPVPLNIDMHDGTVVQTLKAWASTRGIVVEYSTLEVPGGKPGFIVDRFYARIGASRVVVFDQQNKRPLVANDSTDDQQMWRPSCVAVSQ